MNLYNYLDSRLDGCEKNGMKSNRSFIPNSFYQKEIMVLTSLLFLSVLLSSCVIVRRFGFEELNRSLVSPRKEEKKAKGTANSVLFDEQFLDVPAEPEAASKSHLFPNDRVFGRTERIWEAPGGSSSGFPYWVAREGSEGYMFENAHPSPWSEKERIKYYYNGIAQKHPVALEAGYTYIVEETLKITKWASVEEYRSIINKVQIDFLGRRSVGQRTLAMSFFTLFGPIGGYAMIGLDDPSDTTSPRQAGGFNWIILGRDGWEWVPGKGIFGADQVLNDRWFTVQFKIICKKDELQYELSFVDNDAKKLQNLVFHTKDKRAMSFYGQGMQLHIQTAQQKSEKEPKRNFKMRRVLIKRDPL